MPWPVFVIVAAAILAGFGFVYGRAWRRRNAWRRAAADLSLTFTPYPLGFHGHLGDTRVLALGAAAMTPGPLVIKLILGPFSSLFAKKEFVGYRVYFARPLAREIKRCHLLEGGPGAFVLDVEYVDGATLRFDTDTDTGREVVHLIEAAGEIKTDCVELPGGSADATEIAGTVRWLKQLAEQLPIELQSGISMPAIR